MTDRELYSVGEHFSKVEIQHIGLSVRLASVIPKMRPFLVKVDKVLTSPYSPFKSLAQQALVTYTK